MRRTLTDLELFFKCQVCSVVLVPTRSCWTLQCSSPQQHHVLRLQGPVLRLQGTPVGPGGRGMWGAAFAWLVPRPEQAGHERMPMEAGCQWALSRVRGWGLGRLPSEDLLGKLPKEISGERCWSLQISYSLYDYSLIPVKLYFCNYIFTMGPPPGTLRIRGCVRGLCLTSKMLLACLLGSDPSEAV